MKCTHSSCDQHASVHLMEVRDRACFSEVHVCELHASYFLSAYYERTSARRRDGGNSDALVCFDFELIICDSKTSVGWVYLRDPTGQRCLGLETGLYEAWLLQTSIKRVPYPRPLTHECMANLMMALGGQLKHVLVDKLIESEKIYHAKLCIRQYFRNVTIDLRPSDAFNLAVVCERPIYFTADVVQRALSSRPGV